MIYFLINQNYREKDVVALGRKLEAVEDRRSGRFFCPKSRLGKICVGAVDPSSWKLHGAYSFKLMFSV